MEKTAMAQPQELIKALNEMAELAFNNL